ncbi:reverse transcriptase (RNA-dependent DNA polymerase) [Cricetibacter osteomyelitidis]|uniref:Reverse transcriptase (RNA-dependent DNA polymerase) n=1 Tax=Cricetibacter osteomyelitidis TaxID=1521931 RepID=A0A4R2SMM8_9PAST|nr:reverse transcriptase family protein [Cricetibacter osteomyelitidis]TCP91287.1 reverse transcriptase (RNA-dependent DNA polymerase) [Cricetibacter osteomyelitidis]
MKKKKKLITHNKEYTLDKSPLFNIEYIKRLVSVLNADEEIITSLIKYKAENYNCFSQGKKKREIQTPINELYLIHNRIASLLARIKLPKYLYSGVKNRSYIDNAKEHLNSKAILTTDVTAFFPSTTRTMIFWFFKDKMQCSSRMANILADLCSINDHLPTGSQISMPLAYWVNSSMFKELHRLAEDHKLKMTVYVDDLTFSGEKVPKGFKYQVEQIIKKHKHQIKSEKTTLYNNQSVKEVTGLILKEGKLLPPNRQLKKLHQHLNLWEKLIESPRNGIKIEWLYPKVIGVLNNITYFRPEYKNVIFAIQKEYHQYKNTPSNYKNQIDAN